MATTRTAATADEVDPEYCEHGKELGTGGDCHKCEEITETDIGKCGPCIRCHTPNHTGPRCCESCLHNWIG